MEENVIVYVFNFKDFKDVVIEGLDKTGRFAKSLRKKVTTSLLFLACLFFLAILIAYQFPNYSFLVVFAIVGFICYGLYFLYLLVEYYLLLRKVRKYETSYKKIKYQKTIVTEDAITIETDIETVTSKWQEVSDLACEYGYIIFKNGNDTYFFIERSMNPEHVTRLKEILSKKAYGILTDAR
jgi:hypothetical protein